MDLRFKPEYIYYPATAGHTHEPPDSEDVEITGIAIHDTENPDLEFPALTKKQYNFFYNNYLPEIREEAFELERGKE